MIFRKLPIVQRSTLTALSILKFANYNKLVQTHEPKVFRIVKKSVLAKIFQSIFDRFRRNNMADILSDSSVLAPPSSVRGMKVLDRSLFKKTVPVPTLKIHSKQLSKITKNKYMKKTLLRIAKIPGIIDYSGNDPKKKEYKLILLHPDLFKSVNDIPQNVQDILADAEVDFLSWNVLEMDLNYENWNYHTILKAVLPKESQGVAGFANVGHIIHLNLKEELEDYKFLIGQVILDKVKYAKTVVNKLSTIDNTYRNFQMEVLAGEPDFITTVSENGRTFKMDFSKVYWNSKLSTEHQRLVDVFSKGDTVFDVFAGVGPFAVPAAKKGCLVFANDLNPESFKWLNENCKLNKLKEPMKTFNMDGREFVREVMKKELTSLVNSSTKDSNVSSDIHVVMNLPAMAIEFVDTFFNLLSSVTVEPKTENLPRITVYCYCFSKDENAKESVKTELFKNLGCSLPDVCNVRFVRNVSPNKDMYCIVFPLSWDILTGRISQIDIHKLTYESSSDEPDCKRLKHN